jgi:methyl-accepting chemotaxis protein
MSLMRPKNLFLRDPKWFWFISFIWTLMFFGAHWILTKNGSIVFHVLIFVLAVIGQKTLLNLVAPRKELARESNLPVTIVSNRSNEKALDELKLVNRSELNYLSKYLKKNSEYLLGIFDDQFQILKKVESHTHSTRRLVEEVESRVNGATDSSQQAQKGADVGRNQMSNLSSSVESLNEVGILLNEFSHVFKVLTTQMTQIDSIVFMAKLLSFNATVEAARVGDLGQGMSVVALEMTKLAQQIGSTSKEIQTVLKSSNDSLNGLNTKITSLLSNSTELISSTQTSLNTVIDEIFILSGKINEITGSLSDYKKSTSELDEILNQITKTSNTLGTASANTDLVRLNLNELENLNLPKTGTES